MRIIYFRPDGANSDVRVESKPTPGKTRLGEAERIQFPLLPAHCVTVHRVQGCTVEGGLHVLLNGEFFAYGQAYVALSRVRRLSQVHLWCLNMDAFKACPRVAQEYSFLRMRPLDRDYVDTARIIVSRGVPAIAVGVRRGMKRTLGT